MMWKMILILMILMKTMNKFLKNNEITVKKKKRIKREEKTAAGSEKI
jgi:hypothetical protein